MVSLSIGAMVGALLTYLGMVLGYVVRERIMRETMERMNALKQPPLTEAEKWQIEQARIAAHRFPPKYEAVKLDDEMIDPPSGPQTPTPCTCGRAWQRAVASHETKGHRPDCQSEV